jgi:hypothetical protein
MSASAAAIQTKARPLPPVLPQHRVAVPDNRGTDGYRNEFAGIAKGAGTGVVPKTLAHVVVRQRSYSGIRRRDW